MPYELHADATAAGGTLTIAFRKPGRDRVFQARSAAVGEPPPFTNPGRNSVDVTVTDRYTSTEITVKVGGGIRAPAVDLSRTRGRYDLTIEIGEAGRQQYAGHVESDGDSITDPLMGGLV